ncbi:hypothetical protein CMK11_18480 [Candidatus Poribacteria bacterium]|nr:hypothetical protein [Candidatus Poribacteria bacterium]
MSRLRQHVAAIAAAVSIGSMSFSAGAVEVFRVSDYDGGSQIWFEAEAFDERLPEGAQFFPISGEGNAAKAPDDTFGEVVTRAGGAGGRLSYTFDISRAGGNGGTWYFFGRVINPSNQSDYMLVESHPDDDDIPDEPPFPGGDGVKPFDNADDRIFEQDTPAWAWAILAHNEGHTKQLEDGENTMHIFHRQGNNTRVMDVFVWVDDVAYLPTDDDYISAEEKTSGLAVDSGAKLTTAWGRLKRRQSRLR